MLPCRRRFRPVLTLLLSGLLLALARAAEPSPAASDRQFIAFPDPRLAVYGLPWFGEDTPVLRRLPARLKSTFRDAVWSLAQSPSGGRLRFRTDSATLGLTAENPGFSNMHHMASVGENGFDLYVDRRYVGSAWPDSQGRIAAEWRLGPAGRMRDITLHLPLYKPVTIRGVTLDRDAACQPATPYRIRKPVVYYGSSITQGGCASNPGGTCPALLERRLDADFVNLGFSGNGLGDPAVAAAIAELDPSAIVLDFWANPPAEQYAATLPPFVATLRARHPSVPILITTPFYFPAEATNPQVASTQRAKRQTAATFVKQRRAAGDRHLVLVDGLKMLNADQTDGLVDGVHCNSLGFFYNARGLEPALRRVLRQP